MPRQSTPWRRSKKDGKPGAWYSQIAGEKVWLAPAEATKTDAYRELHRRLADEKRTRRVASSLSVEDVANLYLDDFRKAVERGDKEQGTYTTLKWMLFSAVKSIGKTRAEGLYPKDVQGWIEGKATWNPSTRNAAIKCVKMALAWARRSGYIETDRIAGMERPMALKRTSIPTDEEIERVVEQAGPGPLGDLLFALRETGCRPGEAYSLTADRVNLESGYWLVKNKTRRHDGEPFRKVFLTDAVIELTRRRIAANPGGLVFTNQCGTQWRNTAVARKLKRIKEALGIATDLHAYGFRHRFVTRALANHVPIASVAALVGHSDTRLISAVYSQLEHEWAHLRDATRQANRKPEGN